MLEQINTNTYLQTDGREILMVLERLVVIDSRLYRHRIIEEKGIANLHAWHHVVELLACMYIFAVYAKIDAVLLDVVASAHTYGVLVGYGLIA